MTEPKKRNIRIYQGQDIELLVDCDDIVEGSIVQGEMRLWPNGPLLAVFEGTVDIETQSARVFINGDNTGVINRSGVYDVEHWGPTGKRSRLLSGKAELVARVTQGLTTSSSRLTWKQALNRGLTWKQLARTKWRQF